MRQWMDVRLEGNEVLGQFPNQGLEGNLGSRLEPNCCLYSEGLVFCVHNIERLRP